MMRKKIEPNKALSFFKPKISPGGKFNKQGGIMIKLINVDYIFDEKEIKETFKNADLMFQRGQLKTVDEEESFLKQELNDLYYNKLRSFA